DGREPATSVPGLGRVKTLRHGEHLERSSFPASVARASQARRLRYRGTGRTRFPPWTPFRSFHTTRVIYGPNREQSMVTGRPKHTESGLAITHSLPSSSHKRGAPP